MQKHKAPLWTMTVLVSMFLLVQVILAPAAGEIDWYSYSSGMDKAEVEDKPVFIDFWATWCGPCVDMEENVYPDSAVVEKSDELIFIKVNVDKQGDIASRYGVQSIPTLLFLTPEGGEITKHVGKLSASELVDLMDDVLSRYENAENDGADTSQTEQGQTDSSCPLWNNILLIEILVSTLIAGAIILYLSRSKKDKEGRGKKKI
ncbi:MAG: thioredoxin family protein [Thermoplasmata archaeon]